MMDIQVFVIVGDRHVNDNGNVVWEKSIKDQHLTTAENVESAIKESLIQTKKILKNLTGIKNDT